MVEDDLPWLEESRNGPAATGLHEWHGWRDPGSFRQRWAETRMLGDSGGTLMVMVGPDRAGSISWRTVRTGQVSHCWAIGIGLAEEFRGRGHGSQAHRLMVRYLFAYTQVNRIEAITESTNIAEQRALDKAGFTREGVLRGATYRAGRWHDQIIYSVLRDEVELA